MVNNPRINRKDKEPSLTVNNIKNILKQYSIEVIEKDIISYGDYWFSLRVEIINCNNVGTNGKGITLEYARASAYAELMERIQSGCLLHKLFKKKEKIFRKDLFTKEEIKKKIYELNNNISLEKSSIFDDSNYRVKEKYYDYFQNNIIELPKWYIECNCGSNGLCAGNTPEEAIVQGLNENFERYVRKQFYYGDLEAYTIPLKEIENITSAKLIKKIEEKGYKCFVKDFTDGGKYPVLGLVILDNTMNKYIVSLAADLDINICLQRCITEIFQGRSFPLLFKNNLINIFDKSTFFYNSKNKNCGINYQKAVSDNSGAYPIKIFSSKTTDGRYTLAFIDKEIDNKTMLFEILNRIKQYGWKLYIKDYSILEFPTYRIYIPGVSEMGNLAQHIIKNYNNIKKFDSFFYKCQTLKINDVIELERIIKKISKFPLIRDEEIISYMTGIPFKIEGNNYDLEDYNLLLTFLYFKNKEFKRALKCYKNYIKKSCIGSNLKAEQKAFFLTLNSLLNKEFVQTNEDIIGFFSENKQNYISNILDSFQYIPTCPKCILCNYNRNNQCSIENLNKIIKKFPSLEIDQTKIRHVFMEGKYV